MKKLVLFVLMVGFCFGGAVVAATEPEWKKIWLEEGKTYYLGSEWAPDGIIVWSYKVREGNDPKDMEYMMGCISKKRLFNDESLSDGETLIPVPYLTGINADPGDENIFREIYEEGNGVFSCEGRKEFQSALFTNKSGTTWKKMAKTSSFPASRVILPNNKGVLPCLSKKWQLPFLRGYSYPAKVKWEKNKEGEYKEIEVVFSFKVKEDRPEEDKFYSEEDMEKMILCKENNPEEEKIPTPWFSGVRPTIKDLKFLRNKYLQGIKTGGFTCDWSGNFDLAEYSDDSGRDPYFKAKRKKKTASPVVVISAD